MPAILEPQTALSLIVPGPLGDIRLRSDGESITGLWLPNHGEIEGDETGETNELLQEAARQLTAYFAGELREFDVPVRLAGTAFQQQVWDELTRIPFGETISYAELARRIGNPNACRAVGLANGRNPVSIIVPCHRVIGANGTLTGYGGGLSAKKWLLEHERRNAECGIRNAE